MPVMSHVDRLAPICAGCKTAARTGARFCDHCGLRLRAADTAPSAQGELRVGTLLFCDLVQSTQLAYRLDPDDLRHVFAAMQRAVRQVSWRHDGYLERFVGDGAFIVFGYPVVHEDSALSAVAAGLGLVQAVAAITDPTGVPLQLRVGIASGQVVMGEMVAGGAAIDEHSISGPVAHLAARLAAAAAPGTVLACRHTHALVGRRVGWQAMGDLQLRGVPEPQAGFRACALHDEGVSRFDAIRLPGLNGSLIGRDGVLQTLLAHWTQAAAGHGQGLLLQGDAGIGKSRLARALLDAVQEQQPLYLDLQCTPRARLSPLHPVGVLLRRLAGIESADDSAAADDKAGLLLRDLVTTDEMALARSDLRTLFQAGDDAPGGSGDSPELVRERLLSLLTQLLLSLCKSQPVLLLVEDLHWSDPTTLALLQRVLQEAAQQRLLLLATARPAELSADQVLPHCEAITLPPLAGDEARHLVAARAGAQALSASVVDGIVARGEGVPLFLEELTHLVCSAPAASAPGETRTAAGLPTTLHALVQARLDSLPDLRPVLQAASVLGREFPWQLLKQLAALPNDGDDVLRRLVDAALLLPLESVASGRLRFKHALIQDAVYDSLLRGQRQQLHSQAADLIAVASASAEGAPADLLAYHLASAGRASAAVNALLTASQRTAARAAYQEAIGHAGAAIALLDQVADVRLRRNLKLALLAQQGMAMTALQGYAAPEVERIYAEAGELHDLDTPAAEMYPVLRGLASYHLVRGQIDRADRLAQQCLALAYRAERADLTIDAESFAGYPAMYLGRYREGLAYAERALALYATHAGRSLSYPSPQEPATAALALITTCAWLRGDLRRADEAAAQLVAHLAHLNSPFDHAFGEIWLSASCQLQRRHARALELGQSGLVIAQRHGLATWIPAAVMEVQIALGALYPSPEAIATLQHMHQAFLGAGAEISATFYLWGLARAMLVAGDNTAALAAAEAGLARARSGPEVYLVSELLIARAASLDSSQHEAARDDLTQALDLACRQGIVTVALRAAAQLALRPGTGVAVRQLGTDALRLVDGGGESDSDLASTRAKLVSLVDALRPSGLDLPQREALEQA